MLFDGARPTYTSSKIFEVFSMSMIMELITVMIVLFRMLLN